MRLGTASANFVGLIDKLEQRGLVERRTAADRRSYALHLTAAGRKLIKSLHTLNTMQEQRLRASLDPQRRALLLDALNTIVASIDEPPVRAGVVEDEPDATDKRR